MSGHDHEPPSCGPGRDLRGGQTAQETSKQYIKDGIDACCELECDLFPGPHYSEVGRSQMETAENRKQQWDLVVKNLRDVCLKDESLQFLKTDT
jgi:hypothetical protein